MGKVVGCPNNDDAFSRIIGAYIIRTTYSPGGMAWPYVARIEPILLCTLQYFGNNASVKIENILTCSKESWNIPRHRILAHRIPRYKISQNRIAEPRIPRDRIYFFIEM